MTDKKTQDIEKAPSDEYYDNLLQEMILQVPQLRRLWTWTEDGEVIQDNIQLMIVFNLLKALYDHYSKIIAQLRLDREAVIKEGRHEVITWIKEHPGKDKHTFQEWTEWRNKLVEWEYPLW